MENFLIGLKIHLSNILKERENKIKFFLSNKNMIFDKGQISKELKSLGYLSGKPPEILKFTRSQNKN